MIIVKKATFIILTATVSLYSQIIPQVNIPLTITDGTRTKTLYFGLDPSATDGIDPHLDEMEQPPLPPSGVFDARFIGTDINIPQLGEGVLKDYRFGYDTTKGQRIHELRYQVGTGNTITIIWNFPSGVTGLLQDFFGGVVVNVNMTGSGNTVVTNPGIINKLKMTITYNLTGNLLPSPPTLRSPLSGSINQPTNLNLQWTQVSGAVRYHLQVALDSTFNNLIINDSTIQTNSHNVQLQNDKLYYWRVRARNNAGWSTFSTIWNFRTIMPPPSKPQLHSPPKGAFGLSTPIQLKWFVVTYTNEYLLIVSKDSSITDIVLNKSLTDTSFLLTNLLPNTTYYWKVEATNSAGTSSSDIWYFTTLGTSVHNHDFQKKIFFLHNNFPNPFNGKTKIAYSIPEDSFVKFRIFNINGEELYRLEDFKVAGSYSYEIDFTTIKSEKTLASGFYFYQLQSEKYVDTKKMIFLK